MAQYRLYFLDRDRHMEARHDFQAADDGEALDLAAFLNDACSDVSVGYELWDHARFIFSTNGAGSADLHAPRLDAITLERQRRIVDIEETFQQSHWHLAQSRKLIEATEALRQRCAVAAYKDR